MGNKIDIPGEILDNAIAAIELGVEDYKLSEKDPRRVKFSLKIFHFLVLGGFYVIFLLAADTQMIE